MVRLVDNPEPKEMVYEAYGASAALFRCRHPEVLIEGPAGTGKTRGVLEYLNMISYEYPGIRILICRQTLASLRESVQVTLEDEVWGPDHECLRDGNTLRGRMCYDYENGTHWALGGLDTPERTFSTQYDVVVVFEAIEISRDAWEKLGRCNRNNVMPYQQRIADTNPGPFGHWLNKHFPVGRRNHKEPGDKIRLLSRHRDNPSVTGPYLKILSNLTGANRARLFEGKWVGESGQVWPEFSRDIHLIDEWDMPQMAWYFGSMDFGYNAPGCFQVWGVDSDERMYLVNELYREGWHLDKWADEIANMRKQWPMRKIIADSAEPRSIDFLNDYLSKSGGRDVGRIVRGCDKSRGKKFGLDQVRYGLALDGRGKPRLFFSRQATRRYGVDPELERRGQLTNTVDEIESYVFPKDEDGREVKELPDKGCSDHGCDGVEYAYVWKWRKDLTPRPTSPRYEPGTYGFVLGHHKKKARRR